MDDQNRNLATELPGPKSKMLHARRTLAVGAGVGAGFPLYIDRAQGAILHDVDGNRILDFGSGIAVTALGHAHPRVVDAVTQQVAAFSHTCFMVSPYEEYVQVCEELALLTPGNHPKRSALFSSGSEAVENAVKIARNVTGRSAIIVFENAYHGRTNLTMAMTAKNMPYKDGFGPFAGEIYRVPMSYPYRDGLSGSEAANRAVEVIESQVGARNVAAVVIEPIQGEGGFIVPAPGFLPTLSHWSTSNEVIFIADEIQSGMGRTGDWFAVNHEGVVPDLVTVGKGLASGLPLAGVSGRADLMNAVHEGGLGGTYSGNPIAAAAALATIEVMRDSHLLSRAREIEDVLITNLKSIQDGAPEIGEIRGRGAMVALEFVEPGSKFPNPSFARAVVDRCNRNGIVTLRCGSYGNVLRLLPPLVITNSQLEDGLGVLRESIAQTQER